MFLVVVVAIKLDKMAYIDETVYDISQYFASDNVTTFFKIITFLASPICLVGFLLLVLLFLHRDGLFLLGSVSVNQIVNEILKAVIQRNRPDVLAYIYEKGYSCPSGHAMGAVIFYGTLLIFLWNTKLSKKIKWVLTILGSILILAIGFSRMYLGVHYFSDILAGFLLALFLLVIIGKFYKNHFVNL